MIERQASHLTHLVDDLLDVARITRGRVVLKRETMSLDYLGATRRSRPCSRCWMRDNR